MKKLLFLVGLIMVTTACSFNSSTKNMTISEEDKDANFSFVLTHQEDNGFCYYAVCITNYDETTETLRILTLTDPRIECSFFCSAIKDEYLEKVKNNKVTLLFQGGKMIPVVVEKDERSAEGVVFEQDFRTFRFRSILKNSDTEAEHLYLRIYHGMFINGFCRIGDQVLKNGRFFFSGADFSSEITGDENASKGLFSAGLALYRPTNDFFRTDRNDNPYRFSVVQTFYENNYLVIRAEDGATYRYPIEAFDPLQRNEALSGKNSRISAVQLSNGHWLPIYLYDNGEDYRYSGFLWNSSKYYDFHMRINYKNIYDEFMQNASEKMKLKKLDAFYYVREQ